MKYLTGVTVTEMPENASIIWKFVLTKTFELRERMMMMMMLLQQKDSPGLFRVRHMFVHV